MDQSKPETALKIFVHQNNLLNKFSNSAYLLTFDPQLLKNIAKSENIQKVKAKLSRQNAAFWNFENAKSISFCLHCFSTLYIVIFHRTCNLNSLTFEKFQLKKICLDVSGFLGFLQTFSQQEKFFNHADEEFFLKTKKKSHVTELCKQ